MTLDLPAKEPAPGGFVIGADVDKAGLQAVLATQYIGPACEDPECYQFAGYRVDLLTGRTNTMQDGKALAMSAYAMPWNLQKDDPIPIGTSKTVSMSVERRHIVLNTRIRSVVSDWTQTYSISAVALSPDGRLLAAGGDGHLWLWDIDMERELDQYRVPETIRTIQFGPEAGHLLLSSRPSQDPEGDNRRDIDLFTGESSTVTRIESSTSELLSDDQHFRCQYGASGSGFIWLSAGHRLIARLKGLSDNDRVDDGFGDYYHERHFVENLSIQHGNVVVLWHDGGLVVVPISENQSVVQEIATFAPRAICTGLNGVVLWSPTPETILLARQPSGSVFEDTPQKVHLSFGFWTSRRNALRSPIWILAARSLPPHTHRSKSSCEIPPRRS